MTKGRLTGISTLFATLLLAVTSSLTLGAGTAAATTTAPAADPNCTGYGTAALLDAAYIKRGTTNVGSVQLCQRRLADGTMIRWTAVTLYYTMGASDYANGRVASRRVGDTSPTVFVTCASPGGTGVIVAPDRTCASGGSPRVAGWQDRAEAYIYNTNNAVIAVGVTGWHG